MVHPAWFEVGNQSVAAPDHWIVRQMFRGRESLDHGWTVLIGAFRLSAAFDWQTVNINLS
jgi:hypothetical protein